MLHVEKLQAENFLSFESLSLDFSKGIIGILGVNKDADAADSNGAGKSSIFDAIYFALYGKSLRGLNLSQLVRKGQSEMSVCLAFSDHTGQSYELSRGRSGTSSTFSIKQNGEVLSFESRGFQKAIDGIVGMSEGLFKQVVLFGQGTKRFSELSDSEKKELIEEVLQLDIYSEAASLASKDASAFLQEKQRIEALLEQQAAMLEQQEILLKDAEEKKSNWSFKREIRILQLEEDLDNLKAREAEHAGTLNKSKFIESRSVGMDEYRLKVKELETVKQGLEEMGKLYEVQREELLQKRQDATEASQKNYQEFLMYGDLAKGCCPTCGGKVAHAGEYQEKASASFAEYEKQNRRRDRLNGTLEQFDVGYRELRGKEMEKVKGLEYEIQDLGSLINDAKVAEERVRVLQMGMDGIVRERSAKEQELERVRLETNPHDTAKVEKSVEQLRLKLKEMEYQAKEKHRDWKYASVLSSVLGTKGLRSFLFESILPELNEGIERYTEVVSGGSLSARLTVYSETAKGEKREKVSVEVYNPTGGDVYEALSSGEKKRLDLPLAFALQEVVHRRGLGMNITLLDEAFENVDESGASGLLALFREVIRRNQSVDSLLVVTHDQELGGRLEGQIRIEKQNGVSRLC